MQLACDGIDVFHDVRTDFLPLMRRALEGKLIAAAHGPIYEKDPAEELLYPYVRADVETGWSMVNREPDGVPEHVLEQARQKRQLLLDNWMGSGPWWDGTNHDFEMLNHWARAGLVLEICRRRGVNVRGLGKAHNTWKLKGTQTGRFGAYAYGSSNVWPHGFHPLTIPEHQRDLVVPSVGGRMICVMDFKAMDLCSMMSLVPGLSERYGETIDYHARTAELLFGKEGAKEPTARDVAKIEVFVHAYGGHSSLKDLFTEKIPELEHARHRYNEQGEFARRVQTKSSEAFRAALSNALPMLMGEDIIPMFTVHDELVLDITDTTGYVDCIDLAIKLEEGASKWIGTKYRVEPSFGLDYAKAKAA